MPFESKATSDTRAEAAGLLREIARERSTAQAAPEAMWRQVVTSMLFALMSAIIGSYALAIDRRYARLFDLLTAVLLVIAARDIHRSLRRTDRPEVTTSGTTERSNLHLVR